MTNLIQLNLYIAPYMFHRLSNRRGFGELPLEFVELPLEFTKLPLEFAKLPLEFAETIQFKYLFNRKK